MRENEARAALRELGVATAPIFLGMRDGTLAGSDREHYAWLVEQIAQSIASYDIDIVLGPWAHDPHGDHVATARAITNAVASTSRSVRVLYYVVWAPIRSSVRERRMLTRHVAIEVTLDEDQVDAKKRALLCHRTQTSGLIDDDPHGFRIDDTLMHAWLRPAETLYARAARGPIRTTTGGSL
jgi:LmbE family N-acetylglucosaminyl deacetylase